MTNNHHVSNQPARSWNISQAQRNRVPQRISSDANPYMGRPLLDAFLAPIMFLSTNFGVSLLIIGLSAVFAGTEMYRYFSVEEPYGIGLLMAVQLVIVVVIVAIWGTRGDRRLKDFVGWRFKWIDVVWGFLAVLTVRIVTGIIGYAVGFPQDLQQADEGVIKPGMDNIEIVITMLGIALFVPIAEELAFRGVMQRALARRYSGWVAVLVTGLLFGFVHIMNYVNLSGEAILFALGIVTATGLALSIVAQLTGRIGPALVGHIMNNSMVLIVFLATEN